MVKALSSAMKAHEVNMDAPFLDEITLTSRDDVVHILGLGGWPSLWQ